MGVENLVIARTDSEAATLITSNIDIRDHPFILGSTNPDLPALVELLNEAERQGKTGTALKAVEEQWMAKAGLALFGEVLARAHYNHTPVPGSRAGSVPPPTAFPSSPSPTLVESPRSGHSSSDRGSVHGSAGTGSKLPRKKSLLHRVVPCHRGRSEGSDDRWVYVDIEHKVTQRVCTVSPCR